MRVLLAASLVFSMLFGAGTALAAKVTIRIGVPNSPAHGVSQGYEKFKEIIEKKSDGEIQVKLYLNAVLGSDRVTTESAQRGQIEASSCSSPNMASFSPAYAALDLPYITTPKYQENLRKALDNGPLRDKLDQIADSIGFVNLMYMEYGYRSFVSATRPISNAVSYKGLKVRTTDSPVEVAVAKAVGMIPAPIAWGETYTALQQGTVDAEGNTYNLMDDAKHGEVIKYATDSQHNYSLHLFLMNKKFFNRLSAQQQTWIREAAAETIGWERAKTDELELASEKNWLAKGIVFYRLTDADREELKKLTRPVWDQFQTPEVLELIKLIQDTQK